MDELYKAIEEKIKASGYPGEVSGFEIYHEICDFIEDKENGTFIFMSKKDDDVVYEYNVEVHDEDFNLSYLDIKVSETTYHVDFDA